MSDDDADDDEDDDDAPGPCGLDVLVFWLLLFIVIDSTTDCNTD